MRSISVLIRRGASLSAHTESGANFHCSGSVPMSVPVSWFVECVLFCAGYYIEDDMTNGLEGGRISLISADPHHRFPRVKKGHYIICCVYLDGFALCIHQDNVKEVQRACSVCLYEIK